MKVDTYKIESVSEFIEHIEKGTAFFYRGQSQDWPLVPSIDRVNHGGFDELLDFEHQVLSEFRRLSKPYYEEQYSQFNRLILHAQHQGLPTRLLDWTSNPLKALFFAVEDSSNDNDAVVWSFDAFNVEWNEEYPQLDRETYYFHRPSHLNSRIVAQESVFLVFPLAKKQTKILSIQDGGHDTEKLGKKDKFIIPNERKKDIKATLASLGINKLSLFPGIDGVVNHLREYFLMDCVDHKLD